MITSVRWLRLLCCSDIITSVRSCNWYGYTCSLLVNLLIARIDIDLQQDSLIIDPILIDTQIGFFPYHEICGFLLWLILGFTCYCRKIIYSFVFRTKKLFIPCLTMFGKGSWREWKIRQEKGEKGKGFERKYTIARPLFFFFAPFRLLSNY